MPDEDLNDILADEPVADSETQEEVAATATEEAPAAVTEEPKPDEPPAPKTEAQMVPLDAMIEERAKRQALQMQLAEFQKQSQRPPEPEKIPDVFDDQAGFTQSIQRQIQQAADNARLDASEAMARQAHGDELVNEAFEAIKAAGVLPQFASKRDAWGEAVKWHLQQKAVSEIGDPKTYRERVEAEIRAKIQAEAAAAQISAGGPSLAGETNLGGRQAAPAPTLTPLDDLIG